VASAQTAIDRFRQFDKNTDGKLTREKFPAAKIFDGADSDKDGFLTREEKRLSEHGKPPSIREHQSLMTEFGAAYDPVIGRPSANSCASARQQGSMTPSGKTETVGDPRDQLPQRRGRDVGRRTG
jgi:hypothetical protein